MAASRGPARGALQLGQSPGVPVQRGGGEPLRVRGGLGSHNAPAPTMQLEGWGVLYYTLICYKTYWYSL